MAFKRICKLCIREIEKLSTNPSLLAIMLVTPLLYCIFFGFLYEPKRVTEIPAWIIDNDKTVLSSNMVNAYKRHEYLKITKTNGTLEEFKELSKTGKVYACIVIPKHFERDVKKNRQVKVLTFVEGSNMLITNTVMKASSEIAATYSIGVQLKRLNLKGTPSEYTLTSAMPISSTVRTLNNPTMNYMDFLVPGLIGAVIQQVTLLGAALALSKEREDKSLNEILKITSDPLEILLSKGLVYSSINIVMAVSAMLIAFKGFGIKFAGDLGLLILLVSIFVISLTALGIVVSSVAKTQLLATQILMLIAVPSFIASGYTWPEFSMIAPIKFLCESLPLTHFVMPLREIAMNGAGYDAVRHHLIWLWGLVILGYVLAYPFISAEINSLKNKVQ